MDDELFRRLCDARRILADPAHCHTPIPRVAKWAGMSLFHFVRRFRALFGVTPHAYRIAVRMEQARILLTKKEGTVTSTCFAIGLSSVGAFSDAFRRHTGETPSGFRRRALGKPPRQLQAFPGCLGLMQHLPEASE